MTTTEKIYIGTDHWICKEKGVATVGLTAAAIKEIGTVTYVELPIVGSLVSKGMEVVIVESSKAAIDILSPVDGKIIEVNSALKENPSLLESDSEGAGWLFCII
jgi:glycine cleavage system H protein